MSSVGASPAAGPSSAGAGLLFVDYTATSNVILSTKARGAIASGVAYTGSGIAGGAFQYEFMQYMKTVLAPGPPPPDEAGLEQALPADRRQQWQPEPWWQTAAGGGASPWWQTVARANLPAVNGVADGAGAAAAAAPEGGGDGDYVMGSGGKGKGLGGDGECVMGSGGKGKGGLKGGSGGGKGKTCLRLGRESFSASHADAGPISQATQTDGDEGKEWMVVM